MNFSALSIRNPIPAIMLFILLTLAGLLAFKSNAIQDFPDVELPVVTVNATLPGAAPAQLETDVARKIEDSVASLQGLKNIYTKIIDDTISIQVEFVLEKNLGEAVNEVRDAVSQIESDLPSDLLEPVVSKVSTAGRVVVAYAVSAKQPNTVDEQEISWFVDYGLNKRILGVKGVGAVKRLGGVTREVQVELNPLAMSALGVTALDVSRRLKLVQQDTPSGRGDINGAEQSVRTLATLATADELQDLDLPLSDGRVIRLGQVATVSDTVAESRVIALQDGKEVVAFEVFRSKGASETDVALGVADAVAELQAAHPELEIKQIINNATPIQENFDGSMHLLYEGALLAILVIWWFLRDWRAMLIAATALPLSIIPAFLGLSYFGYTLNMVTLLALGLVVGVLVDDAIVEIENISRHLRQGKPPMQAAMEAADEIGMAVIATTFALVAVFLPTAFMGGVPGLFFKQFGWTAVLAIMASLLVARLLTPMMAAYLLKPLHEPQRDSWIMLRYLELAAWCIRHRLITALAAAGFFVGSLMLVPLLPTGFVPAADRNQTQINIELPPGSTLQETFWVAEQARLAAMQVSGVEHIFSSIGGGSKGDAFAPGAAAEVRRAVLTVNTIHRDLRTDSMPQLDAKIRQQLASIPGARFTVGPPDTGVKMQLVLRSDDPVRLLETAKQVERELRTLQGIGNVNSSASLVRPELIIRPIAARAAEFGVTTLAIGETVRVATAGDYSTQLSKLNLSERQIPIRVKLPDEVRADLAALSLLTVPGKNGPVLLANVAELSMESGPAQIDRLNRSRNVTFDVELDTRALGELNEEARALPTLSNLPLGVSIAELGDAQEMQALFASFGIAMAIGVLCIYGVLVLLFKDFMQPITILGALPLSIGGAIVALLLTGKALSMPTMIGLVMLMGIVTKNSILLVDYAIIARREGMARFDALVDACHKRSRPILMTTIAMGAGMVPLALGWGADPSFRSPMAVTVIGGLITSTLLSLLVVPAVFTYVDDVLCWLRRVFLK